MRNIGYLFCIALGALAPSSLLAQPRTVIDYRNRLAPFVASPQSIVDRMLEMADVKPGEMVYDLGSGDGRVLITAVQRFRARAVGVEISDNLARTTTERIARMGLQNDARVIHGDMRDVDLSPANVVVMYLMTEANEALRPKLERSLRSGARVVSHDYQVPGWTPAQVQKAEANARGHFIYLYVMKK